MFRWTLISAVAAAALGLGLATSALAAPDDTAGQGQCSWKPVAPSVVTVSGQQMVTASLERGACTLYGDPSGMTVCLSIQGEASAGQCAETMQSYPARVYYRYQAGATYVMTGRGCANIYQPPYKLCQDYGPSNFTL
jgi:hypothetical protein